LFKPEKCSNFEKAKKAQIFKLFQNMKRLKIKKMFKKLTSENEKPAEPKEDKKNSHVPHSHCSNVGMARWLHSDRLPPAVAGFISQPKTIGFGQCPSDHHHVFHDL
jgi:hypothetical protein